jgi:hypothetical protein
MNETIQEDEKAIFDAAERLPEQERPPYLEKACGTNTELRRRLETRLGVRRDAGQTVRIDKEDTMTSTETGGTAVLTPAEEKIGSSIGRYKLLEMTGEGGFGSVYVAEQQEPVKRHVALKVIKLGMDTKQVVARFEAERQALAMMEHPNIAKVFDAGATDTGRPYFVMELVRGEKITVYCDEHRLTTRQRLKLFIQVCRAIEHAHQKGVIHRDIKPSNILVTVQDGVAVPKVIDFGIAKATSGSLTEKTVFTQHDQFVGTPAYMSPEQAEMSSADIDTRTDIYSLGVLLYELLTSETPFETKNLLARGFDEMRRVIREIEPQLPSLRLRAKRKEERTTAAKRHGTDVPKLISLMSGDLDWVVMKCLEKDRARRYDTADSLAADVQRFLDHEPVAARPPSALYRFQKLVRRNRLAFAAAACVWLALVIALGVTSSFVIKEKQARSLAEIETAAANRDRQNADMARDEAQAQEKKAVEAETQAEAARLKAEEATARAVTSEAEARAALKKASEASEKAQVADQQAQASKSEAQTARQQATVAISEAEKVAETVVRQTQTDAALAAAETVQWQASLSNVLNYVDSLPAPAVFSLAGTLFDSGEPIPSWEAPLLRRRGEWRARQSDWAGAAADFSAFLKLQPDVPQPYDALAHVRAQTGDGDGYGQVCAAMLKRFGAAKDLEMVRLLARDCLLVPSIRIDLSKVAELARRAADVGPDDKHFAAGVSALALAEYRQGHYNEAASQAAKALTAADQDPAMQAQASAILAMARKQLKQGAIALATITTGEFALQSAVPASANGDLGPQWEEIVAGRILTQEAKTLIGVPVVGK